MRRVRYKAARSSSSYGGYGSYSNWPSMRKTKTSGVVMGPRDDMRSRPSEQSEESKKIAMVKIKEIISDYNERISKMTDDEKSIYDRGLLEKYYEVFGK